MARSEPNSDSLFAFGIVNAAGREKHTCLYPVMRTLVAFAHPFGFGGERILQYLHAGINVDSFGGSLADVGNVDVGAQGQVWVNDDRRIRVLCLINKINFEPGSFIGSRGVKLPFVYSLGKECNNDKKHIYDYLSGVIRPKEIEIAGYLLEITEIFGYLWLVFGAVLLCFAQIVPLRQYRLGKNLAAGLAIGLGLLILGLCCVNQFYDIVFGK